MNGQTFLVENRPGVGGMLSKSLYQFTLQGPDLEELYHWAPIIRDRMAALDGFQDVNTDLLLNSPQVRLLSMSQADAYAQRFPFLSRLELKEGVVDFGRNIPPSDTTMVAATAGVLMRDDLHSALANLMTQTLVEVHSKPVINANGEAAIFGRAAAFPIAADHLRLQFGT